MPTHGKRYRVARDTVDRARKYTLDEAVELVKGYSTANFDETIDMAIRLGVNPRHADQMVRGAVVLPHGTGKVTRVVVFAKGDKEREAQEAGADYVGNDELIKKIQDGWLDFDKCIATPDMMKDVAKLGRILGTRGMMPTPKLGTVTFEVKDAVDAFKKGRVEFKVDKVGILHVGVAKKSFESEKIRENILALMDTVMKLRPTTAKGAYIRSLSVSSTMGPGVKIDPNDISNILR